MCVVSVCVVSVCVVNVVSVCVVWACFCRNYVSPRVSRCGFFLQ